MAFSNSSGEYRLMYKAIPTMHIAGSITHRNETLGKSFCRTVNEYIFNPENTTVATAATITPIVRYPATVIMTERASVQVMIMFSVKCSLPA